MAGSQRNRFAFFILLLAFGACAAKLSAGQAKTPAQQAAATHLEIAASDIGGVVNGPNGPEAGVWVIAEATTLPSTFRRIVVTDDAGRFLSPDLPKAKYRLWVRGYGLIDSMPVEAMPGQTVTLTALPAPDARSAAQIFPANYWFSLIEVPAKSEFPLMVGGASPTQPAHTQPGAEGRLAGGIHNQEEWLYAMRKCQQCHQLGDKATREIEPSLGKFDSSRDAWERRVESGQRGPFMISMLSQLPWERALKMLSGWTDHVASGEVPPTPPRPQGRERNLVLTEWGWGNGPGDWIHDVMTTDRRNPTVSAGGKVYGTSEGGGTLVIVDPKTNETSEIKVPTRVDSKTIQAFAMADQVDYASPYWGDQLVWTDHSSTHNAMMDENGLLWMTTTIRAKDNPAFCKQGVNNAYAKNYPIGESTRQVAFYNPEIKQFTLIDTCFSTHHLVFGKDDMLYFSGQDGAVGWIDTKMFERTADEQASQGWCPAYYDNAGTGTFDPKVDKIVAGFPYGISVSPADESIYYAAIGMPGNVVRITKGPNPPATCRTEVYELPYGQTVAPDKTGFWVHGLDVDTNGIVWASLSGSGQLASFDRRKCLERNKKNALGGMQCPDAWTLYKLPGPTMKNAPEFVGSADFTYYNWVDRLNTSGLGKDVPIATGSNSDSLLVLDPPSKSWTIFRVPYPMGFYGRGVDGRIDDSQAGWKGRGLWATYSPIPIWHIEGGKSATSMLLHFQFRPDPLSH